MCSACTSSVAVGGEQRGRAVGALLDVRAVRGAPQHRTHLLGDAGEPRDQDLQRRRDRARPRPAPTRPAAPRRRRANPREPTRCSPARRPPRDRARRGRGDRREVGRRAAARRPGAGRAPRPPRPARPGGRGRCGARARRERRRRSATVSSWLCPAYRQSTAVSTSRVPAPRRARRPRRRAVERARRARGSAASGHDRTTRARRGEHNSPTAESTPARGGTITARMPSASATRTRATGPAPPNATSASSRGSTPCSTVTTRTARSIAASTTRDDAVGRVDRPRVSAARRGRVDVERAEPGERGVGRDAAEHEIGVGHRRLRRRRVRSRPGPGSAPGALGPDDQRAAGVEPRDRAAAGADRVDVEGRAAGSGSRPTMPGAAPARAHRPRTRHTSVLVPPMSKRDRVGEAARGRDRGRRPHAAGRSRQQQGRRQLGGVGEPARAPPADVITSTSPASAPSAEQVATAHRAQVRVDDGRDDALVLAELGRHLVRAASRRDPRPQHARRRVARGRRRDRRGAGTRRPRRRPPARSGCAGGVERFELAPSASSRPPTSSAQVRGRRAARGGRRSGRTATGGSGVRSR